MKFGGGGAPLRSASGQILTSYREDPIISFNESNRKHVDINLRYKASRNQKMDYKAQLGIFGCTYYIKIIHFYNCEFDVCF